MVFVLKMEQHRHKNYIVSSCLKALDVNLIIGINYTNHLISATLVDIFTCLTAIRIIHKSPSMLWNAGILFASHLHVLLMILNSIYALCFYFVARVVCMYFIEKVVRVHMYRGDSHTFFVTFQSLPQFNCFIKSPPFVRYSCVFYSPHGLSRCLNPFLD